MSCSRTFAMSVMKNERPEKNSQPYAPRPVISPILHLRFTNERLVQLVVGCQYPCLAPARHTFLFWVSSGSRLGSRRARSKLHELSCSHWLYSSFARQTHECVVCSVRQIQV